MDQLRHFRQSTPDTERRGSRAVAYPSLLSRRLCSCAGDAIVEMAGQGLVPFLVWAFRGEPRFFAMRGSAAVPA